MRLQTLYKLTSAGKVQTWTISTEKNEIVTVYGQLDGKLQTTRDKIKSGKNLTKSNATTPEAQTDAEAQAQYEKKLKKGYVTSIASAQAGERDACILGGIDVMLAHRYDQHAKKVDWSTPCFVDPKIDGHRMIAIVQHGKCTLWSRTRKRITGLPHIIREIEEACGEDDNFTLDGEAYNHEYHDRFEELTSFIRQVEPKPGHEVVQYHLYDLPSVRDVPGDYGARRAKLTRFFETCSRGPSLKLVPSYPVKSEEEMLEYFDKFMEQGYEGAMLRHGDCDYVGKRSCNLLKVKSMHDAEFLIVNVKEGRGKLQGHAIFTCDAGNANGSTFDVKLRGPIADLKQYWADPKLAIGRLLTVQFFGFTNPDHLPRFPVGLRFREEI